VPTWNRDGATRRGRNAWTPGHFRRAVLMLAAIPGLLPATLSATESSPQFDILGFTLRITNAQGAVTHVLHGERMQQFDALGVQHAEKPRLELMAEDRLDWVWTAPAAVHYPGEQRLMLIGVTEGLQLPGPTNPRTDIETSDVTILTGTREVTTEARATLLRPGLFMTGVGMYADVTAEVIELRSEVDTVYSPDEIQEDSP
jgi:lipopolysaccharide export system protein LptC